MSTGLLALLAFSPILLAPLAGCDWVVMNPSGDIAAQQRDLILISVGLMLLIVVPVLIPTAQALGIDLVHFGVVVVVNIMLGLVTPPYGLLLMPKRASSSTPPQPFHRIFTVLLLSI